MMIKNLKYIPSIILIILMILKLYLNHFKIDIYTICIFLSIILDIYYLILMNKTTNKNKKKKIYTAKISLICFHVVTFFLKVDIFYTFIYFLYLNFVVYFLKE